MTDITVIGDVNVDLISSPIRSYPKKDCQLLIPFVNLIVGGGANNFAFAISRFGLRARLIGLVGNDMFGDYIERKSKEFKIENRLKKTSSERTGVTLGAQFLDGSRSLITFRGTNAVFSLRDIRLEDVRGKALHIGGYNFLDGLRKDMHRIARYAKSKGMLVSLDPDVKAGRRFYIEDLKRTLEFVDIFLPDMGEAELLTGKKGEREIMKNLLGLGCKVVALKRGMMGCVVGNKDESHSIKGIKVKPVNSTGAGDIFNAAFVFKYLETGDMKESGVFANATAALAVTKADEKRFVTEKEVDGFLKRRRF